MARKKNRLIVRGIVDAMSLMEESLGKGRAIGYRCAFKVTNEKVLLIGSETSVTMFSSVDEKGEVVYNYNTACHAGLNSHESVNNNRLKYIVSRIQWGSAGGKDQVNLDIAEKFLDWLTLRSPYAKAFVYGGGKKAIRRGYVIARTDVPSNLLAGAMFAHRAVTEHGSRIMNSWGYMVEAGIDPSIAFCYAHVIATGGDGVKYAPLNWHSALPGGDMDKRFILNFKNGKMENPNDLYYKNTEYSPVHYLWGEGGKQPLEGKIDKLIRDIQVRVKAAVNPFLAGKNVNKADPEVFFPKFAEIVNEYFKENKCE